jgi:hypothetical protein
MSEQFGNDHFLKLIPAQKTRTKRTGQKKQQPRVERWLQIPRCEKCAGARRAERETARDTDEKIRY